MSTITVNLDKSFFSEREKLIVQNGNLKAFAYLFETGVHALRIENNLGYIVTLPYQGQQIWDCSFLGKNLTMKSMFDEPIPNVSFGETYGAFLLHCGATAMGNPSEKDSHPQHGELPNAGYQKAWLQIGEDEKGKYIALSGSFHHVVGFECNHIAEPKIKMYEDSSLLDVSITIENLKNTDMDLMYLMHINFLPVNDSEIIYTADYTPEKVKIFDEFPDSMQSDPKYAELIAHANELKKNPKLHHKIDPSQAYDPELVFIIEYNEDENGDAHTMQLHPDGYADYVSHRPSQLKYGVRWIARTKDEDAIGIVLPATAGHRGYIAEKDLGNVEVLPAGEKVEFNVLLGLLTPEESLKMKAKIEALNAK